MRKLNHISIFWCIFFFLISLMPIPEALAEDTISGKYLSLPNNLFYSEETIVLNWSDTPGNNQDWISIIPAGTRDNTSGEWIYTDGEQSGTFEVTGLNPGKYEARLYFDWPEGGYEVIERLFFSVEEIKETVSDMDISHFSPDIKGIEKELLDSGTGFLSISGNIEYHGQIGIELGKKSFTLENFFPRTSLSFGGVERLEPVFTFKIGSKWNPEPSEFVKTFFKERGLSDMSLASFLALDRESQIMFLVPRDQLYESLSEGIPLDPEQVIQSLPDNVREELISLNAFQDNPLETFFAEIIVEMTDKNGDSQKSHGAGIVTLMLNNKTYVPTFVFDGVFQGSYVGDAGYGEIQGQFHSLAYEQDISIHSSDRKQTFIKRDKTTVARSWDLNNSEPAVSWKEIIWKDYYPIRKISVSIDQAQSLDHLSHQLTILLLKEDDEWVVVHETVLQPDVLIAEVLLPDPFQASGIRFQLYGIPFAESNWKLNVYSAPVPYKDGTVNIEWSFDHVW